MIRCANCPDANSLVDMLDGELEPLSQSAITEHVDACITCQSRLETLVTKGLRGPARSFPAPIGGFAANRSGGKCFASSVSGDLHPRQRFLQPYGLGISSLMNHQTQELLALETRRGRLDDVYNNEARAPGCGRPPLPNRRAVGAAEPHQRLDDCILKCLHAGDLHPRHEAFVPSGLSK